MSLSKILLLSFITLFFAASQANAILGLESRREQRQMLADAREAYRSKNYNLTIDIMEDFLLKNAPKRRLKRAYLLIGSSYVALGAYDKALLKYTEAIEFFPKDVELNLALADIYAVGGLSDRAVEVYKKVLEIEPSNKPARLALARAYLATGSFSRASELFKEYMEGEDILDSEVYFDYALSCFYANKFDTALNLAEKTLEIKKTADAYFLTSRIYKAQGKDASAYEAIKTAKDIDPSRVDIFLTLALWYAYDINYNKESLKMADEYLKKDPSNRLALFIKGFAYYRAGDPAQTVKYLKDITDQDGSGFIENLAGKVLKNYGANVKTSNLRI